MITKEKVLELANRGNWEYSNCENRCLHCGEYQFTGEHKDDCPLGALLLLIEKSDLT
ncbi:MAG: hypothetical protein ACTSSP_00310 [Candidatus Asgardarchaeia archaeon]